MTSKLAKHRLVQCLDDLSCCPGIGLPAPNAGSRYLFDELFGFDNTKLQGENTQ